MGQLNIYHDSQITLQLLKKALPGATLRLATGYFNLTSEYSDALLRDCRGTCHLLTAHPTANGFFCKLQKLRNLDFMIPSSFGSKLQSLCLAAKGIAGGIPAAYTKIEESFIEHRNKMGQQDRVTLWEFIRPGWTYHAKGLWYSLPGQKKPCLTLIGSIA